MKKYLFFSVIIFDALCRFKYSRIGTAVFDEYDSLSEVEKYFESELLKDGQMCESDICVLSGLSELTEEHYNALNK